MEKSQTMLLSAIQVAIAGGVVAVVTQNQVQARERFRWLSDAVKASPLLPSRVNASSFSIDFPKSGGRVIVCNSNSEIQLRGHKIDARFTFQVL